MIKLGDEIFSTRTNRTHKVIGFAYGYEINNIENILLLDYDDFGWVFDDFRWNQYKFQFFGKRTAFIENIKQYYNKYCYWEGLCNIKELKNIYHDDCVCHKQFLLAPKIGDEIYCTICDKNFQILEMSVDEQDVYL